MGVVSDGGFVMSVVSDGFVMSVVCEAIQTDGLDILNQA